MYNRKLAIVAAGITLVIASVTAFADDKGSRPSPPAKAETTVAGKKVTIAYNSPRARGRKVYGGLVPFGQVWRTGANEATVLKTEGAITIGGTKVAPGTYTVFTIPGESGWKLVLSKRLTDKNGKPAWGAFEYDESQDVARVDMTTEGLPAAVENFTIGFENDKLVMDWETTRASVALGK